MNPPTPAAMEEEARGKPSFLRWRAQIENAKGTESVNERTYKYSGSKFVWGGMVLNFLVGIISYFSIIRRKH